MAPQSYRLLFAAAILFLNKATFIEFESIIEELCHAKKMETFKLGVLS